MSSTEKKFKVFALVTYAEPETVTEILEKKFSEGSLEAYAHILHNKDVDEDGNFKEPHTHIVIKTNEYRTLTNVKNWFKATRDYKGEIANTRVEAGHISKHDDGTETFELIDVKGATFYLVHESQKDGSPLANKYHYEWSEIISRNLEMLKNPPVVQIGRPKKEDCTSEILEDILNGANLRQMAPKYGRDFILHYRQYVELANAIRWQEEQTSQYEGDAYSEVWLEARGEAVQNAQATYTENKKLTRENETMKAKLYALGEEI